MLRAPMPSATPMVLHGLPSPIPLPSLEHQSRASTQWTVTPLPNALDDMRGDHDGGALMYRPPDHHKGNTVHPLIVGACRCGPDVVRRLLICGAVPNAVDGLGRNALHAILLLESESCVGFDRFGTSFSSDPHIAVHDADACDDIVLRGGETVRSRCIRLGRNVHLLCESGVDPRTPDSLGVTVLDMAYMWMRTERECNRQSSGYDGVGSFKYIQSKWIAQSVDAVFAYETSKTLLLLKPIIGICLGDRVMGMKNRYEDEELGIVRNKFESRGKGKQGIQSAKRRGRNSRPPPPPKSGPPLEAPDPPRRRGVICC
eukprot:GHVO01013803.1.p1 GENE.GHVO01013803.1~~GHVO01013803.1.p1  ORF type:complete len:323 (-),score=71.98 GHVO01013803.1:75-1019(-)